MTCTILELRVAALSQLICDVTNRRIGTSTQAIELVAITCPSLLETSGKPVGYGCATGSLSQRSCDRPVKTHNGDAKHGLVSRY